MDERLLYAIYGGGTRGPLTTVMIILTLIGNGWLACSLIPFVFVRQTRALAAILALVIASQGLLVLTIKFIVGRVRPWLALGLTPVIALPTDPSFPSGHASGSFAVATFLAFALVPKGSSRWRAIATAVPLYALASGIALSRVYLAAHWPSDVLVGAVMGTGLGALGARYYDALPARSNAKGDPSPIERRL